MSSARLSLELIDQGQNVEAAKALQSRFEKANVQLLNKVAELNSRRMEDEDEDDLKPKDPAIIASEVADQIVRLLEPHAIDSYIKLLCRPICGSSNSSIWNKTPKINMSKRL